MPTPSLLIVPARFKSGKMYSQIPTSGAGDFTVTRNLNTATRVNASGLIESVASGIPRLDYFASGGVVGCPALLVEPSAQNLAFHSETWAAGSNWSFTEVTTATGSTDAFKAPDGTFTANAISPTAASGNHRFGSNSSTSVSYVSGTTYTQSAFFKKGTGTAGRYIQLLAGSVPFGGLGFANYDLELGTVVASGGTLVGASIQNYGNGWYRCICTQTATASGSTFGLFASLIPASGSARIPNMTTSTGDVLYGWGAQLETGSVATSYIPTTTAAVTRNADVVSVSGAVSGSIGQASGTIYCEFAYFGTPTSRSGPIYLRQASLRGLSINFSPSTSPAGMTFISRNDGGSTEINIVSGALQIGTYYKIAIGYDASGTAAGGSQASGVVAYVNGVQTNIGTFRVPDAAGLTEFRMYGANAGADTEAFNGRIRAAALYTTRLTNEQLAALTAP